MKNLWNEKEARLFTKDPLSLRVYTSRLLGREPSLVLHGGGNTSVKATVKNVFGEEEEVLYVKGSGWDLATIEAPGFAPVKMDALKKMAELECLSDSEMVKAQRAAMTDPYAPNPSVEAILHAIIPYTFVDHTHADAVVAVTNTPHGEEKIRSIYGKKVLIVPYVMPGFILAKKVYEMTKGIDWSQYEGMVLMHHGIFTFHDKGRVSYERMIKLVTKAENYIKKHSRLPKVKNATSDHPDLLALAGIRRAVSGIKKYPVLARLDNGKAAMNFVQTSNIATIATRGPLTPDHIIRTKQVPVILNKNTGEDLKNFVNKYQRYFDRNTDGKLLPLDPAPRWAVWQGQGIVLFGSNTSELQILSDITSHTIQAIQWAQGMGGWRALPERDLFEVEYWELEQAKLKKTGKPPLFQGKIALVTGAASGIGKATVEAFVRQGAAVVAVDIDPAIEGIFQQKNVLGVRADLTDMRQIQRAVEKTVHFFGGIDIVVSNAGIFPPSAEVEHIKPDLWQKSMAINLTSHQMLMQATIPFLKLGIDPTVIVVGSKNVPAPGPGASSYSVAKAGLTQLARVAALELAKANIRVNVVHPNQVFDTAIWTKEVLEKRAQHYGMSVEEYKTSNLLKTEITSCDVAELICVMAGPVFNKTTGAQVPIDGGNERVI